MTKDFKSFYKELDEKGFEKFADFLSDRFHEDKLLIFEEQEEKNEEIRQANEKKKASSTLIYAAYLNRYEIIDDLKELGADPNFQEDFKKKQSNNTSLIWAIANGNNEFAKILLEKYKGEIDLKIKGKFIQDKGEELENNALHLLLFKGYVNKDSQGRNFEDGDYSCHILAKIMLELNPELVKEKNGAGLTVLDIACMRRDPKMIKIIAEAGAKFLSNQNIENAAKYLNYNLSAVQEILVSNSYIYNLDETEFSNSKSSAEEALSNLKAKIPKTTLEISSSNPLQNKSNTIGDD